MAGTHLRISLPIRITSRLILLAWAILPGSSIRPGSLFVDLVVDSLSGQYSISNAMRCLTREIHQLTVSHSQQECNKARIQIPCEDPPFAASNHAFGPQGVLALGSLRYPAQRGR